MLPLASVTSLTGRVLEAGPEMMRTRGVLSEMKMLSSSSCSVSSSCASVTIPTK